MKYRKKPIVVEAVQWTGDNEEEVRHLAGMAAMEVVKVVKRTYKVLHAVDKPFLKFGQFRKSRESIGLSVQRLCFNCNHKFKDDDDVYLGYHKAYYGLRTGRRISGWVCKYDGTGKEGGKAWQQ